VAVSIGSPVNKRLRDDLSEPPPILTPADSDIDRWFTGEPNVEVEYRWCDSVDKDSFEEKYGLDVSSHPPLPLYPRRHLIQYPRSKKEEHSKQDHEICELGWAAAKNELALRTWPLRPPVMHGKVAESNAVTAILTQVIACTHLFLPVLGFIVCLSRMNSLLQRTSFCIRSYPVN
jgi:hypothetical protein